MTFSYSSDPADSQIDAVRYLIGDTDATGALVSDEEIQYMIDRWYDMYPTLEWIAAAVLDTLAARYAREAQFSAEGVSVSLQALQEQFTAQAQKLRALHRSSFVGQADVGGISPYEGLEPGIKPFSFGTGMHDNREAGSQDNAGDDTPVIYIPELDPGV